MTEYRPVTIFGAPVVPGDRVDALIAERDNLLAQRNRAWAIIDASMSANGAVGVSVAEQMEELTAERDALLLAALKEGGAMNVVEIIEAYLRANGFDGLYTDDCGCQLGDLMPCDGGVGECCPGYRQPCDCGEGHYYHIGPSREGEVSRD